MAIINFPPTAGEPTDGSFTYTFDGVIYSWTGSYWSANSQSGFDNRYVEVAGDVMTGDLTVPSLNGGQIAGFRNLLINGDFRIWQRGTVGMPAPTAVNYYADHWASYKSSGQAVNDVQLIQSSPPEIASGLSTRLKGCDLRQCVEDAYGLFTIGSTWTLSFWIKGASTGGNCESSVLFVEDSSANPGTVTSITTQSNTINGTPWQFVSHTFTVAASVGSGQRHVMVRLAQLFDVYVTGVQLERGPVATPFENRPKGTELSLCQRYYQAPSGIAITMGRGMLSGASATSVYSWVNFPVVMRITPTMTSDVTTGVAETAPESTGCRFGATGVPTTQVSSVLAYTADAEL